MRGSSTCKLVETVCVVNVPLLLAVSLAAVVPVPHTRQAVLLLTSGTWRSYLAVIGNLIWK